MNVLHIFAGNPSIDIPFIKMMHWNDCWKENHSFVYLGKREIVIKKFPRLLGFSKFEYISDDKYCTKLKKRICKEDLIIWHSVSAILNKYRNVMESECVLSKSVWLLSFCEIEFLQRCKFDCKYIMEKSFENLLNKMKIISPASIFNSVIDSYEGSMLDIECVYPFEYSKIGLFYKEIKKEKRNITQIGICGNILNNFTTLIDCVSVVNHTDKIVLLKSYSDKKQKYIDSKGIGLVEEQCKNAGLDTCCLEGLVRTENYLSYLSKVKTVYIDGVPASSFEVLALFVINETEICICNNNLLKEEIYNWGKKQFDISYVLEKWKENYAMLGKML